MNPEFRIAIANAILSHPRHSEVVSSIDLRYDASGTITYNTANLWVDPHAPGFINGSTQITDEEMVRAWLLLRLVSAFDYPASLATLEIERVYRPVGRPIGKGGRVDVLVRRPHAGATGDAFLFVECKAPDKFDDDFRYIDGQLFRLSMQESVRPQYLVYFTVDLADANLRERTIVISTSSFPDFDTWDDAGQPITDALPIRYGIATKRRFANVPLPTDTQRPLDRHATPETLNRIRTEIHDVIWGGGGTNNNEVFVIITRLILCKIYDEKETPPGDQYQFQRLGDAIAPESPTDLVSRMNELYRVAEDAYLALPTPTVGPAFDPSRVSAEKIAYVVGRLESLSVTETDHRGDLLGEFFEQIVSQDFTQTKGQFFTPVKLVRFMLHLSGAAHQAQHIMLNLRDHLGRPRLPYVIDPSCGSGTFLIEYMKLARTHLNQQAIAEALPGRLREAHTVWFAGPSGNVWARDFLFGIENNYDLGLSAKVNMVLHGDGSMNTWIKSALLPFDEYWVEGRNNVLGVAQANDNHPYTAARNEQFDLLLSNPPFSLKLSPDEKAKIAQAFHVMKASQSEAVFVERWYQLLREGGSFCCILPEAILDTSTFRYMRLFLIQFFQIRAVVSLPYDAFRPFTSTKTCIVLATKRPVQEVSSFREALAQQGCTTAESASPIQLGAALRQLGWHNERIFMAEPTTIGYKRRKNLPDLPMPNLLYAENDLGHVAAISPANPATVLDAFYAGDGTPPNSTIGFWATLDDVALREGFRLDPKYRWLWDFQHGVVLGDPGRSIPLSDFLEIVDLPKVPKGDLEEGRPLIDLEFIESRQALVSPDVPTVDQLGSDKVRFTGCDLAISKLEPYLAKILIAPPEGDLGSTEWVGLRLTRPYPRMLVAYFLMLPRMCETYRRLQSGKRHARFDPQEFLSLRVQLPPEGEMPALEAAIIESREQIITIRRQEPEVRNAIDTLLQQ